MSTSSFDVIAVVGPTASGKSALAEELALALDGEIISADSMQVYRGMDIGTAKVPFSQRRVAYHCIDLVDPGEQFSAALYQQYARSAITSIRERGKIPIMCGGTGFYLRAALEDMVFPRGEQLDNPVRNHYTQLALEVGSQGLHDLLEAVDPPSAALIHPNNTRRVIRAFEMLEDGTSYAQQHEHLATLPALFNVRYLGIALDPPLLNRRIDTRVDAMMRDGLFEEVSGLLAHGWREGVCAPQAIGYKELVPVIDGGFSHESPQCDAAIEEIKTATRRYAKRQRSWFRQVQGISWLSDPQEQQTSQCSLLDEALASLESS